MGDNVYGDVKDNTKNLKSAYNTAKVNLAQFNKHNILAIWDDHDYGINDGGSDFVHKQESKELFLNFWDISKKDPRWKTQVACRTGFACGQYKDRSSPLPPSSHRSG